MEDTAPHDDVKPTITAVPSTRVVYCTSCGVQLDGMRIGEPCPNCGVPVGSVQSGTKNNGKAVASMILGICSIVGCLFYAVPGFVCGILAIIFAKKAEQNIEAGQTNPSSRGMANAGRICGIIGICLSAIYTVLIIIYIIFMVQMVTQTTNQMQPHQPSQPIPSQPVQPSTPPSQP